jgi:ATP-dependent Lon protease
METNLTSAITASALLNRPVRGGLVVIGGLNLGGSVECIHNPIDVVELAREKTATTVLMPVGSRSQLLDLFDEVAARVPVVFYPDAA